MPSDALAKRLEIVEITVESLAGLPMQVASLDTRVASLDTRVASLELQFMQFRAEVRGEFSALRTEVRDGDEQTRTEMRVLHEEVLDRIAALGEGWTSSGRVSRQPHQRRTKKR